MKIILALVLFLAMTPSAMANNAILPPDQVISKDKIVNYHINFKNLSNKAILRITFDKYYDMSGNELTEYAEILKRIEIIDDGIKKNTLFEDISHEDTSACTFLWYKILKGSKEDYLMIGTRCGPSAPAPYYCQVYLITPNKQIKWIEGYVFLNENETDIGNPKIADNEYVLIEDKYIISTYYDDYLHVQGYFYVDNNNIYETANKEFSITPLYEEKMNYGEVKLYSAPNLESFVKSVNIDMDSNAKLLGLINTKSILIDREGRYQILLAQSQTRWVHIQVNTEKYWIPEPSVRYLGFGTH